MPLSEFLSLPLPAEGLTSRQYDELLAALDEWQEEIRSAIRAYPAQSYELGAAQTIAFLKLAGRLGQGTVLTSDLIGPTKAASVQWLERYTLTEIEGAIAKYVDEIKSAVLHGLRGGVNPTQVASRLWKATHDAEVDWRLIARTEMVRANAAGRLDAIHAAGYDQVWAPRHAGACSNCRRLLEEQVFNLADVRDATNFGRKPKDWVACIPLHPRCRHVWLPYLPDVFEEAQREYRALEDSGLDDKTLNEMFDSSGQVKPEYANDPRLAQFFADTGKTVDPLQFALGCAVTKTAGSPRRPPHLRHTDAQQRNCHHCRWMNPNGKCDLYDWPVERDEVCDSFEAPEVGKGFFDNPQIGLDPLVWDGEQLREAVRERIVSWWRHALGADAPMWSHIYITGSAAGRAWAGRRTPSDVDVQVIIEEPELRAQHPEYADLSDPELHAALVTQVRASLDGVEVAPGLALDAFVRPETTPEQFEADAAAQGQGVWDVVRHRWVVAPPEPATSEDVEGDGQILEGDGGKLALEHPEWMEHAHLLSNGMQAILDGEQITDEERTQLQEAYSYVHDLRAAAYHGADGQHSLGQFLWQYLLSYGPLARVKHLLGDEDLAKVWPAYTYSVTADWQDVAPADWPLAAGQLVQKSDGLAEVIAKRVAPGVYEAESGEVVRHSEVAKAAKGAVAPDAGVEHWITVHPHGPGTDGQPVLVRNSPDGKSMVVIGGAGGHLNYLRIDRSRQMKPADGSKAPEQGPANEPGEGSFENKTPEQIAAEESEAQAKMEQAAKQLEQVKAQQKETKDSIHAYVKQLVDEYGQASGGEKVGWDQLTGPEQTKLLAKLKISALHQAATEPLAKADTNQGGIVVKKSDNPEEPAAATLDEYVKNELADRLADTPESDRDTEGEESAPKKKMPLIALTEEQAKALNDLYSELAIQAKQASVARKIAGGDTKGTNALAIDYAPEDVDKRTEQRVASHARTEAARLILETAEAKQGAKRYEDALRGGGFDSLDTFAQAVLGDSQLKPEVARLLGIAGTAQLIAHRLHSEAKAGRLDMDKAYESLSSLVSEREVQIASRARARALKAAEEIKEATKARKLSGQSTDSLGLWTETATNSLITRKANEASESLGHAIGSLEAASALKVAMQRLVGPGGVRSTGTATDGQTKIKLRKGQGEGPLRIGGFAGAYPIKQLAAKAGIDVSDRDIRRLGNGNYELSVDPAKLDHLFTPRQDPRKELSDQLEKVRTASEESELVQSQRTGPGMVHTLSPAQAKGKMFLLQSGSGLLAFEPGVGKTHTAIAAAMQKMAEQPGKHRALIIAPKAVAPEWYKTIMAQGGSHSVQVLRSNFDADTGEQKGADWKKQVQAPADFNVVSYETLREHPEIAQQMGCTIHIADEIQKGKNAASGIAAGMRKAGHAEGVEHRWALTGTPIEKDTGDIHTMLSWANPEGMEDQQTFRDRWNQTGQFDELGAEDRMRQFREGISDRMFHLRAADSGNDTPPHNEATGGKMQTVKAELSQVHREHLRQKVAEVNGLNAELREKRKNGEVDSKGRLVRPSLPFGGRDVVMRALHKPEGVAPADHGIATKVADLCEQTPDHVYDGSKTGGQHAGTYAGKTVVFAEQVGHLATLRKVLEARGIKVFEAHGSKDTKTGDPITDAKNTNNIQDWLKHGGKAVLLTSDKNNAGVNLQLGTAKGQFQHGATRLVHLTLPMNNATIAQREARINRNGAVAPTDSFHVTADTPFERLDRDRLTAERRRQDLVGNREDEVATMGGGRTRTIRQRYTEQGGRIVADQGTEEADDDRAA